MKPNNRSKILLGSILFITLYSGALFTFAIYQPSDQMLDPTCLPTDLGCYVSGGTPSSPLNSIQYNNAGSFYGDSLFTRDITNHNTVIADNLVVLDYPIFSGSGLNDLRFGGSFTGTVGAVYTITISSVGAQDTFDWSCSCGGGASGVLITGGSPQSLNNGVLLQFSASSGHTLNDSWSVTAIPISASLSIFQQSPSDVSGMGLVFSDTTNSIAAISLMGNLNGYPSGAIFGMVGTAGGNIHGGVNVGYDGVDMNTQLQASNNSFNYELELDTLTGLSYNFNGNSYTFPASLGLSGEVLTTDGAGTLSWQPGTGGGGITYGGAVTTGHDLEIPYIDSSGNFASDPAFNFTTSVVHVPALSINNVYAFPTTDGSNGQVMATDGAGTVSWQTPIFGLSPWVTTGSDIYFNTGKVGVGTNTPIYTFEAHGDGTDGVAGYFDSEWLATRVAINSDNGNAGFGLYLNDALAYSNAAAQYNGGGYDYVLYNDQIGNKSFQIDGDTNYMIINAANGTLPNYQLDVRYGNVGPVAGFTNNDGTCTVDPTMAALSCSSDSRLKKNIQGLVTNDVLAKVLNLRGVTYEWLKQTDGTARIGFIAQELEAVFPEFVQTNADGYKSVSYGSLTPVLVEAIKALDLKIKPLEDLMTANNTAAEVLRVWLANTENKITRIFTGEICLTEVNQETECITRSELHDLKQLLNTNSSNSTVVTTNVVETTVQPVETAQPPEITLEQQTETVPLIEDPISVPPQVVE